MYRPLLLAIAAALAPLTPTASAAAASQPSATPTPPSSPIAIALTDPTAGSCPQASYVVVNPGAAATAVFLVVPPGPAGCPPGIDLTIDAGAIEAGAEGTAAGEAVALPLTASSCQAGTDLTDSQLTALGQTPGAGITTGPAGGGNSACPGGDAALLQLQHATARLTRALEDEGIYYLFGHSHGGHVLIVGGAAEQSALAGTYGTSTGTPQGVFTLRSPGSLPARFALRPSSTAGVSAVVCDLCLAGD